MEICKWRA
jgi:hypothetical protein